MVQRPPTAETALPPRGTGQGAAQAVFERARAGPTPPRPRDIVQVQDVARAALQKLRLGAAQIFRSIAIRLNRCARRRDVEDAGRLRPRGALELRRVLDVREVARLGAVAVDDRRAAAEQRRDEPRNRRRILGARILPRTVDVERPEGSGGHAERGRVGGHESFARRLRRRVRRERPHRHVLPLGQHRRVAVDRARRREDEPLHLRPPRLLEQPERPVDVDPPGVAGVRDGTRHGGNGGEVDDAFDASKRRPHDVRVAQVGADDVELAAQPLEVAPVPGGEVVEDAHRIPRREEPADDRRADESAAAGDQDHGAHFKRTGGKMHAEAGSRADGFRASAGFVLMRRASCRPSTAKRTRAETNGQAGASQSALSAATLPPPEDRSAFSAIR